MKTSKMQVLGVVLALVAGLTGCGGGGGGGNTNNPTTAPAAPVTTTAGGVTATSAPATATALGPGSAPLTKTNDSVPLKQGDSSTAAGSGPGSTKDIATPISSTAAK
ncbi:MAG: hypothetical protein HY816_23475 [Candidatus Wallbacteria bacterium]|nr:hypothetical protein [Candidatus Wallbacteria bacterium]